MKWREATERWVICLHEDAKARAEARASHQAGVAAATEVRIRDGCAAGGQVASTYSEPGQPWRQVLVIWQITDI